MKKLFTVFALSGITVAFIAGCKGKDSVANDPKAVLASFFDRLSKKDIDGAAKLATKESQSMLQLMKKGIEAGEKMKNIPNAPQQDDPTAKFKDITLGDAKINGDEATVPFMDKNKTTSFDYVLKKEDGSWKVDFSMATMMKMGLNAAQHGMDNNNMMNNGNMTDSSVMNNMNKMMNMDSLNNAIQKADSVLKNVDLNKLKNIFQNH